MEFVRVHLQGISEETEPPTVAAVLATFEKYRRLSFPPSVQFTLMYLERHKAKVVVAKNKADLKHLLKQFMV